MIKNLKVQVKPIKNFSEIGKSISDGDELDAQTLNDMQVLKLFVSLEANVDTITNIVKFIKAQSDISPKK